jgi:hypothetical protein
VVCKDDAPSFWQWCPWALSYIPEWACSSACRVRITTQPVCRKPVPHRLQTVPEVTRTTHCFFCEPFLHNASSARLRCADEHPTKIDPAPADGIFNFRSSVVSSPNGDQKSTRGNHSLTLRRIAQADAAQLSREIRSLAWRVCCSRVCSAFRLECCYGIRTRERK